MPHGRGKAEPNAKGSWLWRAGVMAVLAVGALLLTRNITKPFTGWHEWNSAFFGYFARNHLRYGVGYTRLLCTHGSTAEPPNPASYYVGHPPLISSWVAISMAIFGQREWAIRLVPILATAGSTWLIISILRRTHTRRMALTAAFFFAVCPATAYFGRMADHVPLVQFFGLVMLHGYLGWSGYYGSTKSYWLWLYLTGCALGIGTGWAAVLIAAAIGVWHGLRCLAGRARWDQLIVLVAAPALAVMAVLLHILWAVDWDTRVFWPLFVTRSYGERLGMPPSLGKWVVGQSIFWTRNFTIAGAIAVVLFLLGRLARETLGGPGSRRLKEALPDARALWVPAAAGVAYILIFKNQSYIHEYWQVFLAPFVGYCLAAVIWAIYDLLALVHVSLAVVGAVACAAATVAPFTKAIQAYHSRSHYPMYNIEMLRAVNERIDRHAPVMTFRDYHYRDNFGPYVHDYIQPQAAYYTDRPMVYERDPRRIRANENDCAIYILPLRHLPRGTNKAMRNNMYRFLHANYKIERVGSYALAYLMPEAVRAPARVR